MIDLEIQNFLSECKESWLEKKITKKTSDEAKQALVRQARNDFSFPNWMKSMLNVAESYYCTHPAKFTHSTPLPKKSKFKARDLNIIVKRKFKPDGFLKSGNSTCAIDLTGYPDNGSSTMLYKFLNLLIEGNLTVAQHLGRNTQYIQQQLALDGIDYEKARSILYPENTEELDAPKLTAERIKQVYFPVNQDYHLLSVLTPSGLMYELKKRIKNINDLRFTDEGKEIRAARKNNKHHSDQFSDVWQLSEIGFGGANKQNVSVLNNQNGGTAYLLSSIPPVLQDRTVQPPRKNFFVSNLWLKAYADDFQKLHQLLLGDRNNIHIRNKRDLMIRSIFFQVTDRMWLVRHIDAGWSDSDHYNNLPHAQKVWLDQRYAEQRDENLEWMEPVKADMTKWFINGYRKVIGDQALDLGDDQMPHIKDVINGCEEALR
jgi:CRISPR-associated protein Csy1